MAWPAGPPSLPMDLAAPAMAGPAALVTRDRPWAALFAVSLAAAAAFSAVVLAFSAAVLWRRRAASCLKTGERSIGRVSDMGAAIVIRESSVRRRGRGIEGRRRLRRARTTARERRMKAGINSIEGERKKLGTGSLGWTDALSLFGSRC